MTPELDDSKLDDADRLIQEAIQEEARRPIPNVPPDMRMAFLWGALQAMQWDIEKGNLESLRQNVARVVVVVRAWSHGDVSEV